MQSRVPLGPGKFHVVVLVQIKMKHLIKILILLFAVTLVTGKPMPDDWGMVRDNDKGAWTDEGDLICSDAREYINSESEIMCCLLKMTCCEHKQT